MGDEIYIIITTATADTNPLKSARLRTTSRKPRRKNPSKKDISPTYYGNRVMFIELETIHVVEIANSTCTVMAVATAIPISSGFS